MFLEELPDKTFHRLLRSVTWNEVDGVGPIKHRLRRIINRCERYTTCLFI